MKCSGEYCAPCSLTRIKSEGKGDTKVKKKAPLNDEKNVLLTDKALQGEEVMSHFSFLAKRERSTRREPGDLVGRSSLVLQKPVVSRESSCWSRFIDVGSCGNQIRSSLVVIHYSIQLFRHFAVRSIFYIILKHQNFCVRPHSSLQKQFRVDLLYRMFLPRTLFNVQMLKWNLFFK